MSRRLYVQVKTDFPAGVQTVTGDMTDLESMREALKGVTTLFLLNAVVPDELTQALTTLDLAADAGIQRIVYFSVFNGILFSDVPHFTAKYNVEKAIEDRVYRQPSCARPISSRMS